MKRVLSLVKKDRKASNSNLNNTKRQLKLAFKVKLNLTLIFLRIITEYVMYPIQKKYRADLGSFKSNDPSCIHLFIDESDYDYAVALK